jgi:thiol-disulfide isomerase/thioredoxin
MSVWITQCLCPSRHCIAATAGEVNTAEEAERIVATSLREALDEMLTTKMLNPWCGLCHALQATWRFETRRTAFRTMDEATPVLERLQAEQLLAMSIMRKEIAN